MRPKLRSLELHGYKTFASRTVFEFPGAITAIVGPNGSGKSNIADAIRWVLGEQAYSLLRAKKTEDMIYLGSEFRPRSSMAMASVIFDNDDSWLPIDFSEVALSRRAYRDGDNEYLLNGQRIRLKEITELLSQSGLAERTYTIIGQGLVDAALSLRPEERRRFFEEAAGIGLYRTRREEALNRLETTRRNLERVRDILGELEPRLNGLDKQARKAQEYERIKADLRLLLRDWYGYHWHKSQNELSHTREIVRSQEAQLAKAREHQSELDIQSNEIRARIQAVRDELTHWHTESAQLHRQWEDINKNMAVLEEREKAILLQLESAQRDQVHLEEDEKSQQIQMESLKSELEKIETELKDAKNQENDARIAFERLKNDRTEKEISLETKRKFLVEAETRQIQYRSRNDELKRQLESIEKSLQESAIIQADCDQELKIAESETSRWSQSLEKENAELQIQGEEKAKLIRARSSSELEIKDLQEKEITQQAIQAKLKAQIEVMEQSEKNLAGFTEGSKSILNAADRGELAGRYIPLSSQIEVEPEFETAIAAVLGEILEGILLETSSDLENALTLLETGEKGRAILILKQSLQSASSIDDIIHPEIIQKGADVIRVSDDLRTSLNLLLDQVYITHDRKTARDFVKNLPGWGRVVTLGGEIFYGNGVVSAGKESRVKLLSRAREKHKLELDLSNQEKIHDELIQQIQKLQYEQSEIIDQIAIMENGIMIRQGKIDELTSSLRQSILKKEQAIQQKEWLLGQAVSFQEQIRQINTDMNQQNDSQLKNETNIKQYRDETETTQSLLKSLSLDGVQIELAHCSTRVAVYQQRYEQVQERLTEKDQTTKNLQERMIGLKLRISESSQTLENTRNDLARLMENAKALSLGIDSITERIRPLENEISEKEQEFDALQENLNSARLALQIADRHSAQAQLDLSRQKDALESLQNRIEEDFGLVSYEYGADINGPTPLPFEGMVEQLPIVKELPAAFEENINRQKAQLRRMGPVNLEAQKEFQEVSERFTFLTGQVADLNKADEDLRQVITELDELMKKEFRKTFDAVAVEFKQMFNRLFNGGQARLELIDEDDPKSSGVEIEAKLPGRREQGLNLLSGGERSLTAVALIFALLKISPTPFCILDEVDAMLDEANVGRFCDLLKELSVNTQFIIITHNRNTVQVADVIYGVTMAKDSTSQVISLKMDEITDELIQ